MYCRYLYLNCLSAGCCRSVFTQSTYFYQVYDDNRWWTSWYQTLGKGGTTSLKIYVGIDIAKLNHFATVISSDGEIILEPFKFTNDADGFQLLVSKLDSFDKNSIIIGLESTVHYGDNLVRYLVAEFYQVCVLNPIKTCQMRKNNIRKTKTDKVDTYVIAKTLMMQDDLRFVSFYDLDMMDLKALGRFVRKP